MTVPMRILAFALSALLFVACSSSIRYAVLGTRDYSTIEGEARLDERDDGRFDLSVTVDRLPSLGNLGENLTTYVLWVQPEGAASATHAGVLTLEPNVHTGRGHAVVDGGRFTIRITAETSPEVEQPGDVVIVASVLEPTR